MFINEVEHLVGLSKKSIRYYEVNGLLNPKRNSSNDYRIYSDEDIKRLKVIKFLRELGVSIRELKLLKENKITLEECMLDKVDKIEKEKDKYEKIKSMCLEIIESDASYENIDPTKYFEGINILNKEGFTMRDIETNKTKRIVGAVVSSFTFSLLFIFLGSVITYFQFTEAEKIPWFLYVFLMLIFLIPIICIVYNLIIRIKEIKKGEEDEASKY